jgi:uncharacterized protein YndB with AHSA1/START domain
MKITVETNIAAPIAAVWKAWNTPADIVVWNAASDDWHCPSASVDLRVGGKLNSRMEAKDGSMGFDFEAEYTQVDEPKFLEFKLGDDRAVQVEFVQSAQGVTVRETFDAENVYPADYQRQGWQAILDRFAQHVLNTNATK